MTRAHAAGCCSVCCGAAAVAPVGTGSYVCAAPPRHAQGKCSVRAHPVLKLLKLVELPREAVDEKGGGGAAGHGVHQEVCITGEACVSNATLCIPMLGWCLPTRAGPRRVPGQLSKRPQATDPPSTRLVGTISPFCMISCACRPCECRQRGEAGVGEGPFGQRSCGQQQTRSLRKLPARCRSPPRCAGGPQLTNGSSRTAPRSLRIACPSCEGQCRSTISTPCQRPMRAPGAPRACA